MVIVAGKTVDFKGIAGFLIGLKPDIVSIYRYLSDIWFFGVNFEHITSLRPTLTNPYLVIFTIS